MPFNPIAPFRDPIRRPRAIVWMGVALIVLVVLTVAAIDGTSTYWFCTAPCHIVHDDNTLAYMASTHTNVACVACHEPANAGPATMLLKKMEVAPDLIDTVARTFELPANHDNHVALEMPEEQCTQCHNLKTRRVTPGSGIIIDHEAHSSRGVPCTICHNRVAHPEETITLVLEGDRKHESWLAMDACFRCHGLQQTAKAPGSCPTCHPQDFDLEPPSHAAAGWYALYGESSTHAAAAREATAVVSASRSFFEERPRDEAAIKKVEVVGEIVPAAQVNTCFTCHKDTFCSDCHKLEMPHPAAFKKGHGAIGFASPQLCSKCHARSAAEAGGQDFCNSCHHPRSTPGTPWRKQHPEAVKSEGAKSCFECHDPVYCETCHISGPAAAERFARSRY